VTRVASITVFIAVAIEHLYRMSVKSRNLPKGENVTWVSVNGIGHKIQMITL